MRLLNLGAGDTRPGGDWVNVDNLADTLGTETYGYQQILRQVAQEANYFHMDMRQRRWPWEDASIDGIGSWHCFEHFDAIDLQFILAECYRILKPGGVLRCSVPDASYFRAVHADDNRENCERLFGEPLRHPEYETFLGWAGFLYGDHRQFFSEDALWCTLVNRECPRQGSFAPADVMRAPFRETTRPGHYCAADVARLDSRGAFSLIMEAFKA